MDSVISIIIQKQNDVTI